MQRDTIRRGWQDAHRKAQELPRRKCFICIALRYRFCALTACDFSYAGTADTSSTVVGRENPFRELTCVQNGITKKIVYDYTDPETGVHYLIYSEDQYNAGMGGITPRLNPDGSTMVEKRKRRIER